MSETPEAPHVDRLPAHQRQAYMIGPHDAEVGCVPDCPACSILYSLKVFYDEVDA